MGGTGLQKAGSNMDNHMANAIESSTSGKVKADSMRGSGNTKHDKLDVAVTVPRLPTIRHEIEGKRHSWSPGDRNSSLKPDDIEQMATCVNAYTDVWYALKFTQREPLVVKAEVGDDATPDEVGLALVAAMPECFEATYTSAGNLRVTKPEASDWPSAQSGGDYSDVLIDALDLEQYTADNN